MDGKDEIGEYMAHYVDEMIVKVDETKEDFFFTTIYTWLSHTEHTLIPKELLIRSIECFKREHPDEFKQISIDCMERFDEWKKNHL